MSKTYIQKMTYFGKKIRELRTTKKVPLRVLAAFLGIDTSVLSKVERGQRSISREMAIKIAIFFELEPRELLVEFLSDKVAYIIYDEDNREEILKLAEIKVEYLKK